MSLMAVVAWMWLAAQSVQIAPDLTKPRPIQCWGMRADSTPGAVPCPELATNWLPVSGAEHVIEIKTRRRDTGVIRACWYITTGSGQPCEEFKKGVNCPQGAECSVVYDETHEVWIDGQRWGVLRESEGK